MNKNNVIITKKAGLCCSCGICKNVCPKNCIDYKREKGLYIPVIDNDICIHCGICTDVCPGIQETYEHNEPKQAVIGSVKGSYNAWSKDPDIRHVSASGGCISTIVLELLNQKVYDVAFFVDTYSYEKQLKTVPIFNVAGIKKSNLPKSRYLPVSHENAVSYMLDNRNKRMILIGTSCALRGFRKVVSRFQLNPDNYLFLGLFCDKVFNYNVYDYLSDHYSENKGVSALHLENKESGGWPGNMKLFFNDGSYIYLDKSIRAELKDYFMPERCLYCIDKLNVSADIAFGDNYTKQNSSELGSNSLIIRTENGLRIWKQVCDKLGFESVDMNSICEAQYLDGRLNNLYYGRIKSNRIDKTKGSTIELYSNLGNNKRISEFKYSHFIQIKKLQMGSDYLDDEPLRRIKPFEYHKSLNDTIVRLLYRIREKLG